MCGGNCSALTFSTELTFLAHKVSRCAAGAEKMGWGWASGVGGGTSGNDLCLRASPHHKSVWFHGSLFKR